MQKGAQKLAAPEVSRQTSVVGEAPQRCEAGAGYPRTVHPRMLWPRCWWMQRSAGGTRSSGTCYGTRSLGKQKVVQKPTGPGMLQCCDVGADSYRDARVQGRRCSQLQRCFNAVT